MNRTAVYTIFCSFMLVLISTSLTVSTLHSHNHLEWHHPKNHVDTSHCLTIDSTVCPICGSFFNADLNPNISIVHLFNGFETVSKVTDLPVTHRFTPFVPGRSPPFSV